MKIEWPLRGFHNAQNAELAVAMAHAVDVPVDRAFSALGEFRGVARRLDLLFENGSLKVWDDFAHHPTAIANTLEALIQGEAPLVAVIELRSNTMKAGFHGEALLASAACADFVYWVLPETTTWDTSFLLRPDGTSVVVRNVLALEPQLVQQATGQIIFMSNGGFSGIQSRVVARLTEC